MLLCAVFSCKRESEKTANQLPPELAPKAVAVNVAAIKVPALFAHVPADAPYVFGSFEAVPLEYWAKIKQALGPVTARIVSESPGWQQEPAAKALLEEINGALSAKSLEAIGLSAQGRFVVYGIGVAPVVVRLEIRDEQALRATIDRIAQATGKALPPQEQRGKTSFWRRIKDDVAIVFAITDRQVVLAAGKALDVETNLDLILGIEKPKQNMADGKPLLDAMAKHGFGPHFIGYADTRRIAAGVIAKLEQGGRAIPPACGAEIDQIAALIPRVVVGAGEISAKQTAGGYVFELERSLLAEVAALKVEVPGFAAALAGRPAFAMGAGVDLVKGAALAGRAFGALAEVTAACESTTGAAKMAELAGKLARPLPEPFGKITGGALVVHEFSISPQRTPERIEGFAMVTSTAVKDLVAEIKKDPTSDAMGFKADGKLNKLAVPKGMWPFDVYEGVGERAIFFATGDKGRAAAEQNLGAAPGGKVPLFATVMDYGAIFPEMLKMAPPTGSPAEAEFAKALLGLFGRATMTMDTTDHGVAIWGTLELK